MPRGRPPGLPERSARARRAREAKRDQGQPIEIPRFRLEKTGDNRKDQADRQIFPTSAGLRANEASMSVHLMFPSRVQLGHPRRTADSPARNPGRAALPAPSGRDHLVMNVPELLRISGPCLTAIIGLSKKLRRRSGRVSRPVRLGQVAVWKTANNCRGVILAHSDLTMTLRKTLSSHRIRDLYSSLAMVRSLICSDPNFERDAP